MFDGLVPNKKYAVTSILLGACTLIGVVGSDSSLASGSNNASQEIYTTSLAMHGLRHTAQTLATNALQMRGRVFENQNISTSPLFMQGQAFVPRTVHTPPVSMSGKRFLPLSLNTSALSMRGISFSPRELNTAPLNMQGSAIEPRSLHTQALSMQGISRASQIVPTSPLRMRGTIFAPRVLATMPLNMKGTVVNLGGVDLRSLRRQGYVFESRSLATEPLLMQGSAMQPIEIATNRLAMQGLQFVPRDIDTALLNMQGIKHSPRILGTGQLRMQGTWFSPRSVHTSVLQMHGDQHSPQVLATDPISMHGTSFDSQSIATSALSMHGRLFEPANIFTSPLAMRGLLREPSVLATNPLIMRGNAVAGRPIGDIEQIANNAPADVRKNVVLKVPVRLERLHRDVTAAKISCKLGDKYTGLGTTNVPLSTNEFAGIVDVTIAYELGAAYTKAPNYLCQLLLQGPVGQRSVWLRPSPFAANYTVPTWGKPNTNHDYQTEQDGAVGELEAQFPDSHTVYLRIDNGLYMTGLGKTNQKTALAKSQNEDDSKAAPKNIRKTQHSIIHDFELIRITSLSGSSTGNSTNPFDYQDVEADIEEAQTEPAASSSSTVVALTVDSSLPVQTVASNAEIAIDANGSNVLSADTTGTFSAANVAMTITTTFIGDQENFNAGASWTIISRTHANPVSDSVTPSFVVQRSSGGDFYKITVGFDALGASGVDFDINSLSGHNCGSSSGDCP